MKKLCGNRFERRKRSSHVHKARIRSAGASVLAVTLMAGTAFLTFPTSVFAEEITDYSETYDDQYIEDGSSQEGSFEEGGYDEGVYAGDETVYGDDYSDGQYDEDASSQEGSSGDGGYDEGGYTEDETIYGDDYSGDQDVYTEGDNYEEPDENLEGESEDEGTDEEAEEIEEVEEEEPDEISGSGVLEGTGDFFYENSSLSMTVHVTGSIELPTADAEASAAEYIGYVEYAEDVGDAVYVESAENIGTIIPEVTWDDITMTVSMLDPDSASYALLQAYAEDKSEDVAALFGMDIDFYYEDTELDMSDCYITADITPAEEVIDEAIAESESEISTLSADDEEDKGTVTIKVEIVEISDEGVTELDSESVTEDDSAPTMTVDMDVDNDYGIMVLSEADPTFTVQFYANLDVIYRTPQEGDTDLTVIETHTDGELPTLPQNGTTPKTSVIELKRTDNGEYVMDSDNVLTQMYVDENYEFDDEPDIHHMNKLELNSDYELVQIWKLKEGKKADSEDENDWDVYDVSRVGDTDKYTMEFTNDPEKAEEDNNLILVQDNDVFRFVYDTTENTANLDANFYDYNITDGNVYSSASTSSSAWTSGTKYVYTEEAGINSDGNYSGTGTKYAFGNNNTGTGLGSELWNGNRLNANNGSDYGNGYEGCTFGIVTGLDSSGNVVFSNGITAPNIFYGQASGKETYTGQLFFKREGDTYTLTSAQLSDGTSAGSGLDTFIARSQYTNGSSFGKTIYSNDFWPLDNVSYAGMDSKFGNITDYTSGSILRFNSSGTTGALPPSDDSTDHNSYFGMNFEIEFSYTSDYVGPLEYFFFGDDDMWVFLDDELILDIGGVHSSVGEHVDLWDYLSKDPQPTADGDPTTYTHTLSVFYTERGASGSTCYIQYTLPEVSSVTIVEDASDLLIEKVVEGAETDQEFEFTLTLKDGAGNELTNQYSYIVLNEAGNFEYSDTIKSGQTLTLKDGWRALLRNLPNGTVVTATETDAPGYSTTYEVGAYTGQTVTNTGSGTTAAGTVSDADTTYIKFINSFEGPTKSVDADGDEDYDDNGIQANVGDTLKYKIDYENYYEDQSVTVTITDVLDIGLDYVEGSASDGGEYDESTRTISWTIENVEAGTSGSVTFSAIINKNALEINEVKNTAKVKVNGGPEVETEPVYTPVPDKDVDADGDGEYGDSGEEVQVGDTLTYKIDYQNSYDDPATVTITDVLDVGLDFVEASDGGTYDESTRTITWVIYDVAPHSEEGYYVTFTATVNKNALTENEVTNDATVWVDNDYIVTNEVDNPVPDKDVDADGDGEYGDSGVEVQVGDMLTYIIHYDNGYDKPAVVTITDTLDEGLTYVEGSASNGGTYDEDTRTITWTFESVEAHTDGYVTFQAIVNENAWVENEVQNTGTVIVDNVEKVTNTVYNPVPHKDVDADGNGKYGDSGMQVHVGDTLTYKINYFNGDEENSATVTITDVLDVGLDFVEADNGGTYDESTRTITWVIEDVAAQTGGEVTFQAIVNKNALVKHEVDNKATVQVGETSQETNTVYNPVPEKDVDADGDGEGGDTGMSVNIGDTLTYTIEYFNGYETPATVTITDKLDTGLDFVSADNGGTYNESNRTITWTIEDVEALTGGSVSFQATVNETALVWNAVSNIAGVKIGEESDVVYTNTVENPVPHKDVDINPEDGLDYGDSGLSVNVGDTLTYKIDYENPDDTTATVTITDVLDVGLDFVSADNDGTYDESTRTITWILEDAPAQTKGSVTFVATVNENALEKHEVDNTATVQVGDHPATDTNTVYNPVPEKDVDADGDGEGGDTGISVNVGDTLTYTIEYFNGYETPATVTITDVLDEGLDFVSADNDGTYDESTRTITWTIEDVEALTGGSVSFQATVNESALVLNEVSNTAEVQIGEDSNVVYTNTVENPVTHKDVDIDPEDGLDYGDSGLSVNVGDTLTYKIDYENPDDSEAVVTITDVLDEGLDYVEDSASDGGTYDEGTRTITWVLEGVKAHTSGSVTFEAIVNENALEKHEVDNTATVQVGDHPATETNTVYNPVPEKDVDADGDGEGGDAGISVNVGDTLTYTIEYFNGYETPATVTITDVLDEGLDFVSADNGGTYDESTRTITWTIEDVEALTGGSVSFEAVVNESALVLNEVSNTAEVQIGEDSNVVYTNTVENPVPHKDVDIDPEDDHDYGDSGEEVKVGYTLTYKIDYENPGDTEAVVTITDELDVGLDFVSADNDGTYDEGTRTITWVLEDVPAHTNGSVTFMATVNENALEELEVVNSAIVQVGDYPEAETNEVENPVLAEPKISKEIAEDDYERKEDSGEDMHPGEDTDGDGWGSWDDADNNQEVTYHLKLTDIRKATSLVVHDYLEDGLDFEPETVEISLYDNGAETKLTEDTDYILTQGTCSDPDCPMDGCTYEVEFEDYLFEDISSDAYLMVTYKALTDTHEEDYDDYEDDILNYSYMSYEVFDYGLQTLSVRRTAVVSTETDLFGFGVYKYSIEDGEEVALSGAEFTLERSGMYATFEIEYDSETGEQYYMVTGWTEDASEAGTLISGADGLIRIEGLDDDSYTLTETKAPIGYEIVDETITVEIDEYGVVTVEGDTGSKEFVSGHEVNVENTLILIDVEGTKTWDDADDQDGKRPDSITVDLLANGEVIDTKTVTEADGWSWSFTDLPMYKDGVEVAYHIVEYPIPDDYSVSLDGNNVINQYTPGQTSVAVVKIWDDQNDVDGIRPESVTVELYKNGEATGETLTLSEDNNWIGSFTGLDEYTDGEENVYTVQEISVEGYGTVMTGDAESVYVITNTHTPPEKGVDTNGDDTFEDDGVKVNVGDDMTYQIKYYNYKDEAATVTITDTLDYALDFVSADNGGTYDESTRTITWTIENAEAQAWGEVTFKATVNDIGLLEEEIENYATVKIGNDSAIDTNIVKNPTPDEESETPEPGTPTPGTTNPNPETGEPGSTGGTKTSDADLPILPIAGCCLAAALIAGVLVVRRKRSV